MKQIGLWLAGILGFTLVIGVHELGHFTFCKIFNINTPVFSIGFCPPILHKKIGSTNFVLGMIPLGGYVEISGINDTWSQKTLNDTDIWNAYSFARRPYHQKLLVLLGGIIFNLLFGFLLFALLKWRKPVTPPEQETAPVVPQKLSNRIMGPLAILAMITQSAANGPRMYILFLAVLSINLAVFNLLPIPVFDGGQLLLTTIETIQGHSFSADARAMVMSITGFILILFFIYITLRDVKQLKSQ